jgi:glutamate-1-semialdehyde aminotransferase
VLSADRERQRAFSLGLLAGGVYLPPSHPGFTSSAHTVGDVGAVLEVSERVLAEIAATG